MKTTLVLAALALLNGILVTGCAAETTPESQAAAAPAAESAATLATDEAVHPETKKSQRCYNSCMAGAGRNPTWSDVQFCAYSCL